MKAWQRFLDLQERRLGVATVQKWLRTLKVVRFDACNLHLEADDAFQAAWFEEHIRPVLDKMLLNHNQKPIKVHISVTNLLPLHGEERHASPFEPYVLTFDELDPSCTLENFVMSEENRVAVEIISESVGYDPVKKQFWQNKRRLGAYNPIYLFGGEGRGKTHLLMAAAFALKAQGLRTLYARADTFTEHVVRSIRQGEMQHFRKTYRNIDVLLIDDIHILSGKGATQEEFFHTFNTLHVEGKQIILSANCAPNELRNVEPRLVSRFEWGISLPLGALNAAAMKQALIERAQRLNYPLSDELIALLLEQFPQGTKLLLKALDTLILRTHLAKESGRHIRLPLSPESAMQYLSALVEEGKKQILTPEKIIQITAEHYGIRPEDILSKSQSRECTLPRQIAMHLCRTRLNLPFKKIGTLFTRDHSTVMTSVRQIEKQVQEKAPEVISSMLAINKRI